MVAGCVKTGGVGDERGREWMKRDRKSSWKGEQWIILQEKEEK
jgi:hypothetical protein